MNVSKKMFILVIIFISVNISSQVGINTDMPHPSAILDMESNDKGVLIPRISLTGTNDVTTIPSPANGLLIYNLTDANTGDDEVFSNKIYYFDGRFNRWTLLVDDAKLAEKVDKLDIPRLASYIYKSNAQSFTELSGRLNVVEFNSTMESFGESMARNGASNSEFIIQRDGNYSFNGFANWLLAISGDDHNTPSYWFVGIQKKDNDAATWGSENELTLGMRCMYSNTNNDLAQPCNFSGVLQLFAGNIIRLVVLKKNGATPASGSIEKSSSLGIPYSAGFTSLYFPL